MKKKIFDLDSLAIKIEKLKRSGNVILHCHGVYDLLHPGHIKHFVAAKKKGDILVVTITEVL